MEGRAKKHQDIVPALARMNQVDADACGQHPDSYARQGPMAAKYANLTPYNYAFNDPVLWNDPSGADPWNNGPYAGSMAYYYAVQLSYGGKSPGQEAIMDPGGGSKVTWDDITKIIDRLWKEVPKDGGGASWSKKGGFTGGYGNEAAISYGIAYNAMISNGGGGSIVPVYGGSQGNSTATGLSLSWDRYIIGFKYVPEKQTGQVYSQPQQYFQTQQLQQVQQKQGGQLVLKNASVNDIMSAFRDIFNSSRDGSYTMSDFFDETGVSRNQSAHRSEYVKTFNNGIKLVYTLGYADKRIDTVMPYYPAAKSYALGVGKGWSVNPFDAPTSYTIGRSTINEAYPYAMSIYGTHGNNNRMATLYFSDIYAFMSFSAYVRGK
jgi:hypothetical protein